MLTRAPIHASGFASRNALISGVVEEQLDREDEARSEAQRAETQLRDAQLARQLEHGELDLEAVFHRQWLFVAATCELREPGDFITATIGRSPIVVLRDQHGEVGRHGGLGNVEHVGQFARTQRPLLQVLQYLAAGRIRQRFKDCAHVIDY